MQQLVRLVGIARLAAEGSVLAEKRRVEYRTLPTRKWLNRCNSQRVPFHWSINPYRGCEYGCKYCYARYTHEFMERNDSAAFETEIYAKDWDPAAFRRELNSVNPGQIVGIGTATDPYQPAERKFTRTRQVLETMLAMRGVSIFITSKSNLIPRDIDLLQQLSEHNELAVTVTVTTMDRDLARLTEPFAPRPDLRMKAVAQLARAGIRVGVIANPVLPLITDSEENLEAVARAAKSAGAYQFGAQRAVFETLRAARLLSVSRGEISAAPQALRSKLCLRRVSERQIPRTHPRACHAHSKARRHLCSRYGNDRNSGTTGVADVTLLGGAAPLFDAHLPL